MDLQQLADIAERQSQRDAISRSATTEKQKQNQPWQLQERQNGQWYARHLGTIRPVQIAYRGATRNDVVSVRGGVANAR